MQRVELDCFGCRLGDYGKEIKGATLIDRKRFAVARKDNALARKGSLLDVARLCYLWKLPLS